MKINNFSVNIRVNDSSVRSESDYVAVPHESEYSIELVNGKGVKCDAEVSVDGKCVGTFRINGKSSAVIERPSNEARKFVFVNETSSEASAGNVSAGKRENGLIKVVFTPEVDTSWFGSDALFDEIYVGPKKSMKSASGLYPLTNCAPEQTIRRTDMGFSNNYSLGSPSTSFGSAQTMGATSKFSLGASNSFSSGATILGDSSDQRFNQTGALSNYDLENRTTINLRLVVPNQSKYAPLVASPKVLSNAEPARVTGNLIFRA